MILSRPPTIIVLLLICLLFPQKSLSQNLVKKAHSHNDYLNNRPLLNALENKFKSIEVDIFFLNSKLYVGHSWLQLRKDKTIETLYLDPLWKNYKDNNGEIYKNDNSLYLLVDIKTSAEKTYRALEKTLRQYSPLLSSVISDSLTKRSVTVILSGNRPNIENIKNTEERFVFLDGRLSDVSKNISNVIMPIISMSWSDHFTWGGTGTMQNKELLILEEIINRVHNENKLIRFWASPDNKEGWKLLQSLEVDLINTDKINQFSTYYKTKNY